MRRLISVLKSGTIYNKVKGGSGGAAPQQNLGSFVERWKFLAVKTATENDFYSLNYHCPKSIKICNYPHSPAIVLRRLYYNSRANVHNRPFPTYVVTYRCCSLGTQWIIDLSRPQQSRTSMMSSSVGLWYDDNNGYNQ